MQAFFVDPKVIDSLYRTHVNIMTKIILSVILLFVVGVNYVCIKLSKQNPQLLSGFRKRGEHIHDDSYQTLVTHFFKYMRIANIITFVGGGLGIICDSQIVYFLSLFLPIFCAIIYLFCKDYTCKRSGRNAIIITTIAIFLCVFIPLSYFSYSDLNLLVSENDIEIKGLYGQKISLSDIKEVSLCQSLPPISIKTNGLSFEKTNLGHFRTTDGENVMLFTYSTKCFICITRIDGTKYFLSFRTPKTTNEYFDKIKNKTNK